MSDNREIPHLRWRMQCVCKGFKPECPVQRLRPSRRKCPALLCIPPGTLINVAPIPHSRARKIIGIRMSIHTALHFCNTHKRTY